MLHRCLRRATCLVWCDSWLVQQCLSPKQNAALPKRTSSCAGATTYRTNAIKSLLQCKPSVVRGNASEVMTAAGLASTVKGAESGASVDESINAAKDLATKLGGVVAVSGAKDYVRPWHTCEHVCIP